MRRRTVVVTLVGRDGTTIEVVEPLKLGSSNLLNNRHFEVYGGPYIGRITYVSLLFELK